MQVCRSGIWPKCSHGMAAPANAGLSSSPLDEHQPRPRREPGEVSALLRDVNVTALVHAEQIGDRIARGDRSEGRSVARTKNVDIGVGHEKGARTKDGLEASGRVRLEGAA